ncbi:MAG TPA: acetyl-CoA carboxylase biotin carboxyl carrier protein [Pyrinomonadaceae bacterium]|nr:acetyl-CoA carboxylase biotin carboxyl carrier protein [Pyrinomonadaceae bacterium]
MSENTASAKAKSKAKAGESKTPRSSVKSTSSVKPSLNLEELREVAELVNEYGFTDFEFENENIRVRLSKMTAAPIVQTVQPVAAAAPVAAPAVATASEAKTETSAAAPADDLYQITSPIVGTFYRSPAPDKDSYVKEGSQVSPETVVCIVEAMKLMNEIQAEVSGEVLKVYVENGQPVEFGQPLFGIKK